MEYQCSKCVLFQIRSQLIKLGISGKYRPRLHTHSVKMYTSYALCLLENFQLNIRENQSNHCPSTSSSHSSWNYSYKIQQTERKFSLFQPNKCCIDETLVALVSQLGGREGYGAETLTFDAVRPEIHRLSSERCWMIFCLYPSAAFTMTRYWKRDATRIESSSCSRFDENIVSDGQHIKIVDYEKRCALSNNNVQYILAI